MSVTGKVAEYNEGSSSNLTSTQIEQSIKNLGQGQQLPDPVTLGKGGRPIPAAIIDNDGMTTFDPEEDAIDFYESLEGMLVRLRDQRSLVRIGQAAVPTTLRPVSRTISRMSLRQPADWS